MVNLWNNRHADNIDSSDCIYLFKTLNTIIATKIANNQWFVIIRAIMANNITNAVKIIWYELDENENPKEMFSNINANRIRLTDSELIKAHLLHKIADDNRRKVISEKWSEIEKRLNDDKFWYFIAGREEYNTRIDFIFHIWERANYSNNVDNNEPFMLFSKVEDYLNNDAQNAEHLWEKILNIFETLLDWYDNNTIYHLLGLLVLLDENTGPAEIISKRYCFYQDHTRDAFKQHLFDVIKGILKRILFESRNGNEGLNNSQDEPLDYARIVQDLSGLEYGDAKTNKKSEICYSFIM